jgi:hypothetical protein
MRKNYAIINNTMKYILFFMASLIVSSVCGATVIDKVDFLTTKMPYDSYCKLSLHANLKRSLRDHESRNSAASIDLLELQLVTDLAYLDYVIKNEKDNEYAKYIINMIVYGLRGGVYIWGRESEINAFVGEC